MLERVDKASSHLADKNDQVIISLIFTLINEALSQSYEEEFEIEKHLPGKRRTIGLI
jgi:hypothetical protein